MPDGSIESFTYDHKGRLIKQTSFEGVITVYTYDEFDRVSSKTFFENQAKYFTNTIGETWTYEYDQYGRVSEINQNGRITKTTYDLQGRTILVETPEGKIAYTYDGFGRQTSVQTDNDPPTVYSYDNFGRLSSVTSDGKTTTYEYDAFGNLAKTKLPNGVITTYEYDNMNRLVKETNFVDKNQNEIFDDGEGISQFDYTLDAQGRKTNAIEKFWADLDNDGVIDELFNTVKWGYDNAGRLVYEEFDHYDDAFDQTQVWEYDLVSNRTLQKLDKGNDGIFDEITKYNYDINDRLLEELFDGQNDGIFEKLTLYAYDHTQQTSKTVSENGIKTSETTYEYDLQGRMSVVTITTYDVEENITRIERTSYDYGADGIRTSALHEIDANGDGTFETSKLTEYLNDPLNITGYSQVLKQTETDLQTGEYTITTYIIGHQRISQTVEKNGESSEYYFTFDGHGSTRVLLDLAGVVVQLYAYDAFGNALGFDPSTALTEFLYSGEQFDAKIGQQYLRQRYYDPATGRFNRLDPFFGNLNDPLSLHKYLYTHGDPVNGVDPNGEFMCTIGILGAFALSFHFRAQKDGQTMAIGGRIIYNLQQLSNFQKIIWVSSLLLSMWQDFSRPIHNFQGEILLGSWVTSFLWNRGHDNTIDAPGVFDGSQDTWLWGAEMSIFGHHKVIDAKNTANMHIRRYFANNPDKNVMQHYVGEINLDQQGFSIRGMGWLNWTMGTGCLDYRAERSPNDPNKAIVTYAYRDKIDAQNHAELENYYKSGNPILWALALAEGSASGIPGYYFYVTQMGVEIDLNSP